MAVVFVYGTLTDSTQVSRLLDTYSFGPEAVCQGLQRVDGRYPTLIPGGQVSGWLLSTPEIDRLDSYEGVDRGLYCRVSVPLASSPHPVENSAFSADTAAIYIGDPGVLDVPVEADWPETGPFRQCVKKYIQATNVSVNIQNGAGAGTDDH